MTVDAMHAVHALNHAFLRSHPVESQQVVNQLSTSDVIELLQLQPVTEMVKLWDGLMLEKALSVLQQLPEEYARQILQRGDPVHMARILVRVGEDERQHMMTFVDGARRRELSSLVQYPDNSAGSLMDPRFLPLYEKLTVREALHRIRKFKPRVSR